jgi:Flp pilus assembly protein TadD
MSLAATLRAAVGAMNAGRWEETARLLSGVAPRDAGHPDVLHLNGLLAHAQGDHARAAQSLRRAVERAPQTASYWSNLSTVEAAKGDLDAAELASRRAIALAPDYARAHHNLGVVLAKRENYLGASASFAAALERMPDALDTLLQLAQAAAKSGSGEVARRHAEQACARAPNLAEAHIALGLAHLALDDFGTAQQSFARATVLDPRSAEAWHNEGHALARLGRFVDAAERLERAMALDPVRRATHAELGLCLLARAEFARGWDAYRRGGVARDEGGRFPASLAGRRVIVTHDQGVGDDLFFLRFAPELRRRGAEVMLAADPRLDDLLARSGWTLGASAEGERIVSSDLPWRLGHDGTKTPPPLPLEVDRAHVADLAARWSSLPRPWLAVTWRAGLERPGRPPKSIAPEALGAAMNGVDGSVIVVQRTPREGELARFARGLGHEPVDATAMNDDLDMMLAAMALIDDYIAVSNTNLHLRSALARTTRVLVPMPPEWRWSVDDAGRAMWFPDCTLYRQSADRDWSTALATLRRDLAPS